MQEKFRSVIASAGYHVPYCVYPNVVEHIAKVYNVLPNAKSEETDSPLRHFERNMGLAETTVTVDELRVGVLDTSTRKWPSNRMSRIGATAVKVQLTPPLDQLLNSITPPEEQKVDVERLSNAISSMTYTQQMNLAHEYLVSKLG